MEFNQYSSQYYDYNGNGYSSSLHWCSRWSYSMPHTQINTISDQLLAIEENLTRVIAQVETARSSSSRLSGLVYSMSNQIQELISEESSLEHSPSLSDCLEHFDENVESDLEDELLNCVDKVFDEMPHCRSTTFAAQQANHKPNILEFEHSTAAVSSDLIPDLDDNDTKEASIDSKPLDIAIGDTKSKIEKRESLSIDSNFTDLEVKCDSLFLDCIREIDSAIVPFNTWMGICLHFEKSRAASSLFDKMLDNNRAYRYSLISKYVTAQHMLHHFPFDPGSAVGLVFDIRSQYPTCTTLGAMPALEFGKNRMVCIAGKVFDNLSQHSCCSKVLLNEPSVAKLLTHAILSSLETVPELFHRSSQINKMKSLDSLLCKESLMSFGGEVCLVLTALKHCFHNDPYLREIFEAMRSCVQPKEKTEVDPIMFLHDFDNSYLECCYTLPLLEEAGWETWTIDILGWGSFALDRSALCDVASNCDHLYSLWTTNIKRPMVLVRPSLGFFLASDFSVKYLKVVDMLVSIDASVSAHHKADAVNVIGHDIGCLCCVGLSSRHDLDVLQLERRDVSGCATHCLDIKGCKVYYGTSLLSGFHSRCPQETQLAPVLDAWVEPNPCANYDSWMVYIPKGDFFSSIHRTEFFKDLEKYTELESVKEWRKLLDTILPRLVELRL